MAVKTWADGFGVWHVRVSTTAVAPLIAARRALRDELTARESASAPVAPHTWRQPIRLPDLDTEGTMVYREFAPEAMSEAERFFYEHAGTSYNRDTETAEDGRIRGARDLAAAEARLKAGPYYVGHSPDDEPWDGDVSYDGPLWNVYLYSVEETVSEPALLGLLGSVACEADDPYMRVVAAELALEYLPKD